MVAAHLGRRAQYGSTALIWAAMRGHADCARLLLDAGADKETTDDVRASAGRAFGAVIWVIGFGVFVCGDGMDGL